MSRTIQLFFQPFYMIAYNIILQTDDRLKFLGLRLIGLLCLDCLHACLLFHPTWAFTLPEKPAGQDNVILCYDSLPVLVREPYCASHCRGLQYSLAFRFAERSLISLYTKNLPLELTTLWIFHYSFVVILSRFTISVYTRQYFQKPLSVISSTRAG